MNYQKRKQKQLRNQYDPHLSPQFYHHNYKLSTLLHSTLSPKTRMQNTRKMTLINYSSETFNDLNNIRQYTEVIKKNKSKFKIIEKNIQEYQLLSNYNNRQTININKSDVLKKKGMNTQVISNEFKKSKINNQIYYSDTKNIRPLYLSSSLQLIKQIPLFSHGKKLILDLLNNKIINIKMQVWTMIEVSHGKVKYRPYLFTIIILLYRSELKSKNRSIIDAFKKILKHSSLFEQNHIIQ